MMMQNNFWTSIKKNRFGIMLMVFTSICVSVGQLFWKLSYDYGLLLLLLGFILYSIGALVMIYAYRFGRLSVLQPVLGFGYVLTVLLAHVVLQETLSIGRILGTILVIAGITMICGGDD
jgi:uncharacterized membrane protein